MNEIIKNWKVEIVGKTIDRVSGRIESSCVGGSVFAILGFKEIPDDNCTAWGLR
jgi:hypothetical protein